LSPCKYGSWVNNESLISVFNLIFKFILMCDEQMNRLTYSSLHIISQTNFTVTILFTFAIQTNCLNAPPVLQTSLIITLLPNRSWNSSCKYESYKFYYFDLSYYTLANFLSTRIMHLCQFNVHMREPFFHILPFDILPRVPFQLAHISHHPDMSWPRTTSNSFSISSMVSHLQQFVHIIMLS